MFLLVRFLLLTTADLRYRAEIFSGARASYLFLVRGIRLAGNPGNLLDVSSTAITQTKSPGRIRLTPFGYKELANTGARAD